MINLIKKILCPHDWEEIYHVEIRYFGGGIKGHLILYKCKKCGKFKKVRL